MLLPRSALWSDAPPEPRTREENHPTLLFSWWCTGFASVIIVMRIGGRFVRTGMSFREDKVIALSIIPLMIRMGIIHVVSLYGTNNVALDKPLTAQDIHQREIGSGLVLAARIFYAMFIWISKFTVSEFLKRSTTQIWKKSYERTLHFIRLFLIVTFIAVVIATLAECHPFSHYYQVTPDPGPQCRQGFSQLITMGVADIITDISLVAFPIPIVLRSHMPSKRKVSLVSLFSLSSCLIGITGTRMPAVISHRGRQQYRTVWASCEILASAAVSNASILGSFVRDRGVKRNKYKPSSTMDSTTASARRPTVSSTTVYGSDEDLFRGIGYRVPTDADLSPTTSAVARPAPAAMAARQSVYMNNSTPPPLPHISSPHISSPHIDAKDADPTPSPSQPASSSSPTRSQSATSTTPSTPRRPSSTISLDSSHKPAAAPREVLQTPTPNTTTPSSLGGAARRQVSFFDVGGLLEDGNGSPGISPGTVSRTPMQQQRGGAGTTQRQDFAAVGTGSPTPLLPTPDDDDDFGTQVGTPQRRHGRGRGRGERNRNLLMDLGGLWGARRAGAGGAGQRDADRDRPRPIERDRGEDLGRDRGAGGTSPISLQDVGGLLS